MSSISLIEMFDSRVIVTEQMERMILSAASEVASRAIIACGERYNFDSDEAIRLLGLSALKVSRKETEKPIKIDKVVVTKSSFPLPYNGECNDAQCQGLRQNNGLYTQCQVARKGEKLFCKSCESSADKNEGVPEYGTITQRKATGIFEYVDPKGRKPTAYTKIMKKYKVSQEQVIEEAGKLNITIDENHFKEVVQDKRGRPKVEKVAKEPKGAKGRPKKTKKVLEIECDEEDLFASLVASANSAESDSEEETEEILVKPVKKGKTDEEREVERLAKEEEKAAKETQRLKEKAEKEAKLAAEKAEKEAKLAAEKAEKEAKKEAERLQREAKKLEEELAKKLKEEQRQKEKEEKEASKTKKAVAIEATEEEEPDVVKKITVNDKKYLKSKKTGIIYDYVEYTTNGEQVVVGKWNETKNQIDFVATEEESEEEYDEEE